MVKTFNLGSINRNLVVYIGLLARLATKDNNMNCKVPNLSKIFIYIYELQGSQLK
jgi:hypothetical protein